ncbi:polysaccharide biosynthesis tyrosine autokinase [Clavibacter michiganensis]|uniref:polysaccharide biosynthesis tyrosine autokinase n=1 Tax=Clavibacter michiganensis TaxID=28447 RepID=UPI00136656B0|nr:polysaccharide biosynthesis tyrosine autokinase [Clavibacter michiganensis]MWJ13208.1 chromosome partitioning protein [Clavibacter michiganensis subsp. michiganensis]
MALRDFIRMLRRGAVLIILTLLVGVGAAAAFSLLQTPEYEASTKMYVAQSSSSNVQDLQQGNNFITQAVKSYADVVTTRAVLQPVIDQFGLDVSSRELAESVRASAPLDTTIIDITVKDQSRQDAATLADAIGESLKTVVGTLVPETIEGTPQVQITQLEQAEIPESPSSPNLPVNIIVGALIGLLIGVGVSLLRETLDNRIRGERDVELVTTKPILGGIAYDPKATERPLIVQDDPRSPRAESFRSLRTNLQFLEFGGRSRSFVITSSIQGEGKSTTSSNLALADSGIKVVLIDADLRRPRLASYMGLEGAVGLTDILIGRAEIEDVIQPWGSGMLSILPAGQIPPNPSELLGSQGMARLLQDLEARYDVVLIDAPPLLPVTDAAILSKNAGGAIVVVAAGRTHRTQLKSAIANLTNVGADVLGLVITMLPTKGPDAYGYGHYGYGYGYTEDEDGNKSKAPIEKIKA